MRRFLCSVLMLLLAAALMTPGAAAADSDTGAEELVRQYIADNKLREDNIAVGYRNIVTGEEFFINGDTRMFAASTYKIALNMYWSNCILHGESSWDERILNSNMKVAQWLSLVESDEDFSNALYLKIGTYSDYRVAVAEYYGISLEDSADPSYRSTNELTARELMHCLSMLYEAPDLYPGVLDCLLEAEPHDYLRKNGSVYPIAQKYGYADDPSGAWCNVAAIVYAEQPYLVVIMTHGCKGASSVICSIGEILTAYSVPTYKATPEPTSTPTSAPSATPENTPAPTEPPTASPTPGTVGVPVPPSADVRHILLAGAGALLVGLIFLLRCIFRKGRRK